MSNKVEYSIIGYNKDKVTLWSSCTYRFGLLTSSMFLVLLVMPTIHISGEGNRQSTMIHNIDYSEYKEIGDLNLLKETEALFFSGENLFYQKEFLQAAAQYKAIIDLYLNSKERISHELYATHFEYYVQALYYGEAYQDAIDNSLWIIPYFHDEMIKALFYFRLAESYYHLGKIEESLSYFRKVEAVLGTVYLVNLDEEEYIDFLRINDVKVN